VIIFSVVTKNYRNHNTKKRHTRNICYETNSNPRHIHATEIEGVFKANWDDYAAEAEAEALLSSSLGNFIAWNFFSTSFSSGEYT